MAQITPTTKVAELLAQWPELEPILIAQAPAFQKLRNPILRRTIARVATLEQAAGIAGLPVRDLVVTLRRAVGQPVDETSPRSAEPLAAPDASSSPAVPPCHIAGRATGQPHDPTARVIDADALLNAGEVPIKPVFDAAGTLEPGEVLTVLISFKPLPLVERLETQGYQCEIDSAPDGRVRLSVTRATGC